jgi:hypothetical protein
MTRKMLFAVLVALALAAPVVASTVDCCSAGAACCQSGGCCRK